MGIRDALRTHVEPAAPDYSTHGGQPGPHETGYLAESDRVLAALDRHAAAVDAAAAMQADAPTPIRPVAIIVESSGNPDFDVETFTLSPGEPVAVAGRDPRRRTVEVNLWTADAHVAMTKNRKDAESASHRFPPPRSTRLPGGGTVPRKMTHTAPIYLVLDPTYVGTATVDVIVELAGRPTTTRRNRDDD